MVFCELATKCIIPKIKSKKFFLYKTGSFPPTPQYVMHPQLQGTCHYIVNHYAKNAHLSGGCKKIAPNKLEAKTEKIQETFSHSSKFWRNKALQKLEGMSELDVFKIDFERINEKFTC